MLHKELGCKCKGSVSDELLKVQMQRKCFERVTLIQINIMFLFVIYNKLNVITTL